MPRGRLGRLAAASAGGAALALGLPPCGFWPLGWLGLAPVFLAAGAASGARAAAAAGLAAGFFFHATALHWVYQTCRFAGLPRSVGAAALAALALFQALAWAAAAAAGRELSRRAPAALRPWAWAAAWTAVAFAAERWTPRLPADLLAYTQHAVPALVQAGAWAGPHGLGFLLALSGGALAGLWADLAEGREPSAAPCAAVLALGAAALAHGAWILARAPAPGALAGPAARVEILQPNVDQYRKWRPGDARLILEGLDELLARPRPRPPELVVWPETAIPRWGMAEGLPVAEAAVWAARLKARQIVGLVAHSPEGAHNALQLVGPDGGLEAVYRKRQLVPLGEFVPFRRFLPALLGERFDLLGRLEDMTPGAAEQPLFGLSWTRAAPGICYEAVFPRWALRDARRGARVLVNATNDGWYKDTWGPRQHLVANAFRAVEARAWVLRAANTGVSAAIDPWGRTVASLPLGARGRLDLELPAADPFPRGSFYARRGDWLGGLCLLASLAGLAAAGLSRLRARAR